jgi:prepilin-type N-terminal cleavage/methylation domain-containing protein/prepilin-type processing-associated H-X9-DG protein
MSVKSSFTLIELLVVIGIIAILASLIGPSLVKGQDASLQSACMSNIKAVGTEATRLYFNAVFPDPIDPISSNSNLLSSRHFFQNYEVLEAHYPPPPPPDDVVVDDGGGDNGDNGSGESGSGGGGSEGPVPGPGGVARISAVEMLTLLMEGCPTAEENPLFGVEENVPEYRSYSFLASNAGLHYQQAWPWLISESYYATIESREQLASNRHDQGVNVYFKDGHVSSIAPSEVEFPETQP